MLAATTTAAAVLSVVKLDGTTLHVPALVPTASSVGVVLVAFGLVWRFVIRPIVKAGRYVKERLDEVSALVEQVRDVVQYVGLFGGDVEARLDRIESVLNLGYYRRDRDAPRPATPPTLRSALAERLRAHELIRDLGKDEEL